MALRFVALAILLVLSLFLGLHAGSITIDFSQLLQPDQENLRLVLTELRLPRLLTAVCAGAGLGVAGLMMQTLFRNPLAGPFELGVSSGASLGVAIGLHLGIGTLGTFGYGAMVLCGAVGAFFCLALVLFLSRLVRHHASLLIAAMMLGSLASACVSLLVYFGKEESLRAYLYWSFGSFAATDKSHLPLLLILIFTVVVAASFKTRQLNLYLLGDATAQTMGVNVSSLRQSIVMKCSLLAGIITAFCGPIAFLGLAIPHAARYIFNTSAHEILLPASVLLGASGALLADSVSHLAATDRVMPLNAVLALIGAPAMILLILRQRG